MNEADYDTVEQGDSLVIEGLLDHIGTGEITVKNTTRGTSFAVKCELSERMKDIILCGGLLEYTRNNLK